MDFLAVREIVEGPYFGLDRSMVGLVRLLCWAGFVVGELLQTILDVGMVVNIVTRNGLFPMLTFYPIY